MTILKTAAGETRTASVAEWLERGHEFNPRPNCSLDLFSVVPS